MLCQYKSKAKSLDCTAIQFRDLFFRQRGTFHFFLPMAYAKMFSICFASVQLNEFLNHLIGRNTIFVMVEKYAIDFVFRFLQEETTLHILLKPSKKEWDAYCTGDNIVMLNLVSESPKSVVEYHGMCIEQLLVDIVAEKNFQYLYSRSELLYIFVYFYKSYLIDYVRLLRYARRRGKADEIKKYIGGYESAHTR